MFKTILTLLLAAGVVASAADKSSIPSVYNGIDFNENERMVLVTPEGDTVPRIVNRPNFTLEQVRSQPVGTENGLRFDFGTPELNGRLYYGFIPGSDRVRHAKTIFFNRSANITAGVVEVDIRNRMVGKYDLADWQTTGQLRFGYRIVTEEGYLLYDGKVRLTGTGPFAVDTSIIEGPFVNLVTDSSVVISFETNYETIGSVVVDGRSFGDSIPRLHHEILVTGLSADTKYNYSISYDQYSDNYDFLTAPMSGASTPFTFAYASDGRGNTGGGERDLRGVNAYILNKIGALTTQRGARFFQFTGDMIDGYTSDIGVIDLEYANWKRTVEPYAAYIPFVCGFGNHEVVIDGFADDDHWVWIDRFPFETMSAEAVFARHYVNPTNGPDSEDGAVYDPNPDKIDFPSYKENCFYYQYGNVVMISLNSNYWFAPSIKSEPSSGGNLHGYVMDKQLEWLEDLVVFLENDATVGHIFVTIHTPIFPNGGHVKDDMWYSGSNEPRPTIAGEPVEYGIIERRDQLLDILINQSTKVVAGLTGDEHNYSLLKVTDETPLYPDDWTGERLTISRPFWQINNGAAGAPYYGQEWTPWQDDVITFSTQNAVVFFHVDGGSIEVEVINPDTLEEIDRFVLR